MEEQIEKPQLSVVCPLYNEAGNVETLHKEILAGLEKTGRSFEIIFINDGSDDATEEECKKLTPLTLINFRRNFGQTAALDCGFKKARGEVILTLDGDLQNDPADFFKLLQQLDQGFDVVSGWRKKRIDPFSKRFVSRVAEYLRKFFIDDGIHDSGCTFKAYRRECFTDVDLYGEMHRFIPAVLKIQGFRVGEIEVNHRPRKWGKTKYNWSRTIKGFLDMISVWFWKKYAQRPLHLFGGTGLVFLGAGLVISWVLVVLRLFYGVPLSDKNWTIVGIFLILAGIQLVISGLMADIMVKSYYNGKKSYYSIKDIVKHKGPAEGDKN